MKRAFLALSAALAMPAAAIAGPPFLTDDPEPTATGHWEIYAPLLELEGADGSYDGAVGAEVNYGLAPDVQFTVGLSMAYAREAGRTRYGSGDFETSLKYRFYHDEANGVQLAAFPGLTLPTGTNGMSADRVTALLPVWAQKDLGRWSVFGGGGYAINPGPGKRDYWTGGAAVARQIGDRLLVGIEADRDGADQVGGRGTTRLGLGAIYDLPGPLRFLLSGGPGFRHGETTSFHGFMALGVDY